MEKEQFEMLVADALKQLPKRISRHIENVAFCVEDVPTAEHLRRSNVRAGGTLLGLYQGVPKNLWGRDEVPRPPDKITIFRDSILAQAQTPDEITALVKEVVWHEVAHHFGFDEHGARRLDRKRRSEKESSI